MAGGSKIPRKYWWVVPVGVPIVVALIAILPQLRSGESGGSGGPTVTGNNNTINFDYSTNNQTFITNVNIIAREYEVQTGRPLSDDLRRQITAAVTAAQQNNHGESIRLLEEVAKAAPVPAVFHNLGVAYQKTQNAAAAGRAFALSKEKIAELTSATTSSGRMTADAVKAPTVSGPAIRTESSAVAAMTIEPLGAPYEAPGEIHVVVHGTPLRGSYQVKYEPTPGVPVVMEPGAYDVLMKASSYGAGFVLASNVVVKDATLTRINPNALVGGIAVEPVTKQGFPAIKEIEFVDKDQLLAQETGKLGVTLPIAPGSYDVVATTADGQRVQIADAVAVNAGAIIRFDPLGQVAAIVVHEPTKGLEMKAVYALKAGGNQIAAQVKAWALPMLVRAGVAYDIALDQSSGLARIRKGITPGRGELVEIR